MTANKLWPQLILLLPLIACAGVTSGGAGGSPSSGGPAPILGGQNSLDNTNSGTGSGSLPVGDIAQGQAQPSTQESAPGVGAPCVVRFVVKVKVLRGGLEQSCLSDSMQLSRQEAAAALDGETTGTMAPPENQGPGPEVTFFFRTPKDIEDRIVKAPTFCTGDGHWQTRWGDLHFFAIGDGLHCPEFSEKAHADWNPNGTVFSSNSYSGPPTPDYDDALGAYPITLNIDLGTSKFGSDGIQTMINH